jgi:CrcB protein
MADERTPDAAEPADPDLGAWAGGRHAISSVPVLAVVTLGGALGAAGRYAADALWPDPAGGFPWTTFGVNVLGSGLLGLVTALAARRWPGRPLLRPLLGTGLIGGFTTFSTFAVDTQRLFTGGHALTAAAYVLGTLATCTAATWIAERAARALVWQRG